MKTSMFVLNSRNEVNFDKIDIRDYKSKIQEEANEVESAICSLRCGYETAEKIDHIAEELLDMIQTGIQGLHILKNSYGMNVFRAIDIHNQKLKCRGWENLIEIVMDIAKID